MLLSQAGTSHHLSPVSCLLSPVSCPLSHSREVIGAAPSKIPALLRLFPLRQSPPGLSSVSGEWSEPEASTSLLRISHY